jgi:hypothetical protein
MHESFTSTCQIKASHLHEDWTEIVLIGYIWPPKSIGFLEGLPDGAAGILILAFILVIFHYILNKFRSILVESVITQLPRPKG